MTAATRQRLVLLTVIAVAVTLFFGLGLDAYLTLDALKARRAELSGLFEQRPLLVAGGFMLVHITALSLSIPGAVLPLCLAAGAIFGPFWGTAITLGSITIGDSLGFLIARYLLREWVERHFGRQAAIIDRGVERDGAFYLLALRLMAVVPYFVVNLAMGLTRMRLHVFAPVSFIGLIPATALYVHAGTELARIESPSDIYSPRLIGAFLLLGLLPIAARFVFRKKGAALDIPSSAS